LRASILHVALEPDRHEIRGVLEDTSEADNKVGRSGKLREKRLERHETEVHLLDTVSLAEETDVECKFQRELDLEGVERGDCVKVSKSARRELEVRH
jgi:hypothetical protein